MGNVHSKGQSLSLEPVNVSAVGWGPDQKVFELIRFNESVPRSIRLQAVAYTGGTVLVKDKHGVEIFSGSAAAATAVLSGGPYLTCTAPLQYTVVSGSNGTIVFYGEFV